VGNNTVPWLWRLFDDLSPLRPGFALGSVYAAFVDKMALEQAFLRFLGFLCQYHFTVVFSILIYHLGDEK
jgi:hypothetical protein